MKNPAEENTALEQQITEIMEQGNRLQNEGPPEKVSELLSGKKKINIRRYRTAAAIDRRVDSFIIWRVLSIDILSSNGERIWSLFHNMGQSRRFLT